MTKKQLVLWLFGAMTFAVGLGMIREILFERLPTIDFFDVSILLPSGLLMMWESKIGHEIMNVIK